MSHFPLRSASATVANQAGVGVAAWGKLLSTFSSSG